MPAPSRMFGRQPLNSGTSTRDSNASFIHGNGYQTGYNDSTESSERNTGQLPESLGSTHSPGTANYDEIFISKPVKEVKTMLWEIKDFIDVFTSGVERAMNFEFEMGRLGSMERHLPRRSRWKISLDVDDFGNKRVPALRVLQLSPENKTIFYRVEASILEKANGALGHPDRETNYHVQDCGYKEGTNDISSYENVFPVQPVSSCESDNFLDQIQNLIYDGSLFLKVKFEILEDGST